MKRLLLVIVLGLSLGANAAVVISWLAPGLEKGAEQALYGEKCPTLELDLSKEEREVVLPVRERFLAERQEKREYLMGLRARLARLVVSDPVDREAIAALLAEMSAAQADLQRKAIERVLSIRAALGPENRTRYDSMIVPHIEAGDAVRCGCEDTRR